MRKRPANFVQTIEFGDELLDSLSKAPQGLSLCQLAEKVGPPKGTTHRLVSSPAYVEYVQQNPSIKKDKFGFKQVALANQLFDQTDLRSESRPFRLELAQRTPETTHWVVLDSTPAVRATLDIARQSMKALVIRPVTKISNHLALRK